MQAGAFAGKYRFTATSSSSLTSACHQELRDRLSTARTNAQDSMNIARKSLRLLQNSLSETKSHVAAYNVQLADIQAQMDAIREQQALKEQQSVLEATTTVGESAEADTINRKIPPKGREPSKRILPRRSASHDMTIASLEREPSAASGSQRGAGAGPERSQKRSGGVLIASPYARTAAPRETAASKSRGSR